MSKSESFSGKSESFSAYWPRGRKTLSLQPLSPRLESLEGKTVAFLWDYLFRGDEIFPLVEQKLRERFPGVRFIGYDQFGSTHGEDEQKVLAGLPERLKALGADAVISGMGC
jgi:hypothetical protein